MKKEELEKIKLPLSQKDFENLKDALENDKIERADIPDDVREAMDATWAKANEKVYDDLRKRGIFGEYD